MFLPPFEDLKKSNVAGKKSKLEGKSVALLSHLIVENLAK